MKGALPVEDAATRSAAIGESGERSRAANAAQATLIATFVGLCYVLMSLPGDRVLNLLPAVYSGMLAFYDARRHRRTHLPRTVAQAAAGTGHREADAWFEPPQEALTRSPTGPDPTRHTFSTSSFLATSE